MGERECGVLSVFMDRACGMFYPRQAPIYKLDGWTDDTDHLTEPRVFAPKAVILLVPLNFNKSKDY
jgi:hypothetical protein